MPLWETEENRQHELAFLQSLQKLTPAVKWVKDPLDKRRISNTPNIRGYLRGRLVRIIEYKYRSGLITCTNPIRVHFRNQYGDYKNIPTVMVDRGKLVMLTDYWRRKVRAYF